MAASQGDQLSGLISSLENKMKVLDLKIDEDDRDAEALVKELKGLSSKLDEVNKRLESMKYARNEYRKTIKEAEFANQKIIDSQEAMAEKFATLQKVSISV